MMTFYMVFSLFLKIISIFDNFQNNPVKHVFIQRNRNIMVFSALKKLLYNHAIFRIK